MDRFRRMYCGLCHTLGRRYGPAARFILNYDFTYLAILLSEPEEGAARRRRCPPHPIRGQDFLEGTPALETAADESVILAYWQARDGVADHGRLQGLKYRTASRVLRSAYQKAASLRPDFDGAVRRELARLGELERERCPSLDYPADTFAALFQSERLRAQEEANQQAAPEGQTAPSGGEELSGEAAAGSETAEN